MSRTPDPTVELRNQKLLAKAREQLADSGKINQEKLSREFCVGLQVIQRLLRDAKLIDRTNKQRPEPLSAKEPISHLHRGIGAVLDNQIRQRILDPKNSPDYNQSNAAAEIPLFSPQRVGQLLAGVKDPTLTELCAIARYAGASSLGAFIKSIEEDLCKTYGIKPENIGC